MMIDYAYKNRKKIEAEFRNALSAKSKDIGWWVIRQTSQNQAGDELTVYLLSKMFDRHSFIYTLKEPWCTFVHKVDTELSTLLGKSDLVFVYTTYGFGQIVDLPPAMQTKTKKTTRKWKSMTVNTEELQKQCNTKESNISKRSKLSDGNNNTPSKRQLHNRSRKATTRSQQMDVGESNSVSAPTNSIQDTTSSPSQVEKINKVSASLSSAHIIESDCIHNTRKVRSRKRTNPRSARDTTKVDYTTFYNSEDTTTESSPSPKRTRTVAEVSLREPTESRINTQYMITRKRLQEMSPNGSRVRLLGTVTSPQPLFKPKIKMENIQRETIVKSEKQQEIEDYLAKGLCLSAHTDGSACTNIQNPNNVNVAPMSIREHQKKQRAEKALFLAGLLAKQSTTTSTRNAVTDAISDTPTVQSTEVSTTTMTDSSDTLLTRSKALKATETYARNAVATAELCGSGEQAYSTGINAKLPGSY